MPLTEINVTNPPPVYANYWREREAAPARAVTRYYNASFKPFGLTAEQFSLLVGIGAAEGATLIDLAVGAGVDATTLSRNVQNLEGRGLVHAEGGRGRAGKRLSLTNAGRRLMVDALPVWKLF